MADLELTDDQQALERRNTRRWLRANGAILDGGNTMPNIGNVLIVGDVEIQGVLTANVNTTFGGQITFPATQNASADANTLDDYEEGTWTPANAGVSITVTSARYTKIGRIVFISADLTWPSNANGSDPALSGLPFTTGVDGGAALGFNNSSQSPYVLFQTSGVIFRKNDGSTYTNANFSGAVIRFSGFYTV